MGPELHVLMTLSNFLDPKKLGGSVKSESVSFFHFSPFSDCHLHLDGTHWTQTLVQANVLSNTLHWIVCLLASNDGNNTICC